MTDVQLMGRPLAFERGEKLYLTTPITLLAPPSEAQVEEFAFSSAVKSAAPNEHLGWLSGRYVEAGRANLNGVMWLSDELALKSMTPMLMPITVMHDPRTAVGTIADCKLVAPSDTAGATSRIDTVLAVWKHRFPDVWAEAEANIQDGTMMQSMECLAPSYACSECGQQFIKLHEGKEQGSWCEHLRQNSSRRILQDVCFTGTGLIFGSQGGKGAYTEAYLDHFKDEIAEYHEQAHIDSRYRPSERSTPTMGLVQIEESELATLRTERNDARGKVDEQASTIRDLTTKVEKAEAETAKEKADRERIEKEKSELEDKAQKATLKDARTGKLGQGFLAKLGEFTRERLLEAAGTLSDEEWESALKEKEEMAGVKRDAKPEGGSGKDGKDGKDDKETTTADADASSESGSVFADEELAAFSRRGVATPSPSPQGGTAARQLARSFADRSKPKPRETAKS